MQFQTISGLTQSDCISRLNVELQNIPKHLQVLIGKLTHDLQQNKWIINLTTFKQSEKDLL